MKVLTLISLGLFCHVFLLLFFSSLLVRTLSHFLPFLFSPFICCVFHFSHLFCSHYKVLYKSRNLALILRVFKSVTVFISHCHLFYVAANEQWDLVTFVSKKYTRRIKFRKKNSLVVCYNLDSLENICRPLALVSLD